MELISPRKDFHHTGMSITLHLLLSNRMNELVKAPLLRGGGASNYIGLTSVGGRDA
jgi:hypothetical protein